MKIFPPTELLKSTESEITDHFCKCNSFKYSTLFYNWHKLTLATEQHFFSVGWKKFLHNTCLDIFSVKVCGFWQIENLSCTTHAEGIRVGNNIICMIASYFVDMSHCITTTSTTDMLNTTEVKFKPRHEKKKQKQFQSICWQWITEDVTLRNNKERDFKFHYKFKKIYIWLFFFSKQFCEASQRIGKTVL